MQTKTKIKAGCLTGGICHGGGVNHSARLVSVKLSIRAGGLTSVNHSARLVSVKLSIRAGGLTSVNHSAGLR